jgi:asparagine synthase (glutamine-hydrolysing)
MCGIAGFVQRKRPASLPLLEAMTNRLTHRGPDDGGFALFSSASSTAWTRGRGSPPNDADVALGHRRLSILDLSQRGHQPMASGDGSAWIVYNGEIFNYVELRDELRALGHAFSTGTDTEVILAAYRQWGHAALSRFNGMFAFALWDDIRKELFCARDRLGVKPFYFWRDDATFVFASEIKALFAHPSVPRKPNPAVIYDYLALKIVDHTDETFFAEIQRLPAAHYLIVRRDGSVTQQRWWDVSVNDAPDAPVDVRREQVEQLAHLFRDAVRLRLRSDVPIGTCLSGGIDSSAIAIVANDLIFREHAVTADVIGEHQKTFTACFDDARFDERAFSNLVLAQTGADSHTVFPDGDGLWRDLDRLLFHMDEPFSSTSQYSQYCVMRRVSEAGVKVTLDGQGADELFAGYPGYYGALISSLLVRGKVGRAAHELRAAGTMGGRGRNGLELAARVGYGLMPFASQLRSIVGRWMPNLTPEARLSSVVRPEFEARFGHRRADLIAGQESRLRNFPQRLYYDVFHGSLPALLRYEDRNSMAFSIEARTPFLDYRLVEHAFSMPMSQKISDGWTKRALRDSLEGVLPKEIQWRTDKKGFVTPELIWLRQLQPQVHERLSGALASGEFLDPRGVQSELARAMATSREGAYYTDVFRWLLLELWMRAVFRDAPAAAS